MKFGVREIANVTFKAKQNITIGHSDFVIGQPVLYIDTAKTSTLEGAATTVYATGGRGNTRLIAWEGEKTLTFTVEDALLSPIGFSVLSGAGLIGGDTKSTDKVHVHMTTVAYADGTGLINLNDALAEDEEIDGTAPVFVIATESDGSITGTISKAGETTLVDVTGKAISGSAKAKAIKSTTIKETSVLVDYYILKSEATVSELQIDAENFGGYYYVEADTLFRDQSSGKDMPAQITLPNVKIQSNFTFSMASTGDPSTFTFTMDAFPGYTTFDTTKKVLCVIQVVNEQITKKTTHASVMANHGDTKELSNNVDDIIDSIG